MQRLRRYTALLRLLYGALNERHRRSFNHDGGGNDNDNNNNNSGANALPAATDIARRRRRVDLSRVRGKHSKGVANLTVAAS